MNKRQKKKQLWLRWIGGDYKHYKIVERQRHEQTIAFKRKGKAGHLTDDDIKNFWIKDLEIFPEFIEQICSHEKALKVRKTAFKRASKALAYYSLKR